MQCFKLILALSVAFALTSSAAAEQRWIQGIGYVEPTGEVRRLAFRHAGILGEYGVEIGQNVKAGELLASQRNHEERYAVSVAEAQLAAAKAELARILAGVNPYEIDAKKHAQRVAALDAEYAKRKQDRIAKLQANKFASEDEHDLTETQARLRQADTQRVAAEMRHLTHFVRDVDKNLAAAQVAVAEAQLQAARQRLEETLLRSPIDGTVVETILRVGEATMSTGSPEPALLVGDLQHLRVRAEIDENYALDLKAGQKAVIFGRGLGDREIPAHVERVKPIMGKKTVFAKTATERKDIDVIQAFIQPDAKLDVPIGLEVNIKIAAE
ncbi:MAG: efflux RND transporter periplasmic adaptor subunit [Methylomonas sp.]|nr:efflux RND transporter periplasmic adaptor subunit [Methylomonas sp.]PPD21918.1 MAG: hypothetical protein CTY23_03605 [Methylomonas sp.]PPD25115.1 MAG: hypothetical protein CTY22_09690 [Methylomonas sp.]PPD34610.1 MAG: hypothetical protein CTY21_09720 [Methylomonas sp.]PPD40616.1 MAG: hypothetical protein CTY17_05850 [Methylomonas sp.]